MRHFVLNVIYLFGYNIFSKRLEMKKNGVRKRHHQKTRMNRHTTPWPEWEWMAMSSAEYSMWINDNNVEKKNQFTRSHRTLHFPPRHTHTHTVTAGRVSVRALELSQSFFFVSRKWQIAVLWTASLQPSIPMNLIMTNGVKHLLILLNVTKFAAVMGSWLRLTSRKETVTKAMAFCTLYSIIKCNYFMENTPETREVVHYYLTVRFVRPRDLWIRSEEWVHARLSLSIFFSLSEIRQSICELINLFRNYFSRIYSLLVQFAVVKLNWLIGNINLTGVRVDFEIPSGISTISEVKKSFRF